MANKFRGEVAITLGGKERKLKLDANALASFECEYGKPAMALIFEAFTKVAAGGKNLIRIGTALGFREVRALLWAALLHEDQNLTIRQAGDLIEEAPPEHLMEKLAYCLGKVMEAFKATMPEVSKKNADAVLENFPELKALMETVESTTGASSSDSPADSAD